MKKNQSQIKLLLTALLCAFVGGLRAQQLISTWPVSDLVSYIKFYDDKTMQFESPYQGPYRERNSSSFICDSHGELLFQTNGTKIVNRQFQLIANGDSLTDNRFYQSMNGVGISEEQGVLALPKKGNTYYVFCLSGTDSIVMSGQGSPDRMYYAVVDMDADSGKGRVLEKRVPIYKGVMGDCRITAVRHDNGRDWWLVNHRYNNNCYNKWLITPDSVIGPFIQCIGTPHTEPDIDGMAKFTMDGTRYAMGSANGLVNLLDFDRCTGEFSNPVTINVFPEPPFTALLSSISGLEFSASGRYLYFSFYDYLLQYDTYADTIANSRVLIAKNDSTYLNPAPLWQMFRMPNDEIIIGNYQGLPGNYHFIHSPDSAGLACNFEKDALHFPNQLADICLPNTVNINLGAVIACDTIISAIDDRSKIEDERQIRVFPNPAIDVVFIEAANTAQGELTIADELGRLLYTNPHFDGATAIKVNNWMNGIYFYRLITTCNEQQIGKIVVQH